MQIFNGHYNVADLIEVNRVTKDEILNLAVEGRIPIAVWANNVFAWPVHYSQRTKRYNKIATRSRPCDGEWLYVRRKDLRMNKFEQIYGRRKDLSAYESSRVDSDGRKLALLYLFRSGPQANVDLAASRSPYNWNRHRLRILCAVSAYGTDLVLV